MQHDDIIEITTTRRRRINQLPIRRIYEYEENIEVLIATKTNSKPEREGNYTISNRVELAYELEKVESERARKRQTIPNRLKKKEVFLEVKD